MRIKNLLNHTIKLVYTFLIPVLYFVILAIIIQKPYNLGFGIPVLSIFGIILAISGLLLWITALVTLRNSLSVFPETRKLITSGIYAWFKHPFYIGLSLTFMGLVLATGSQKGLFVVLLVLLPLHVCRALIEEKILEEAFGNEYKNYQKKVKFKWF